MWRRPVIRQAASFPDMFPHTLNAASKNTFSKTNNCFMKFKKEKKKWLIRQLSIVSSVCFPDMFRHTQRWAQEIASHKNGENLVRVKKIKSIFPFFFHTLKGCTHFSTPFLQLFVFMTLIFYYSLLIFS